MEQQQREQITGNSFGDDASWQVGSDEPVADIAAYAAVCDRSRQIAAGLALDDTVAHPRLAGCHCVHMIRELARHYGQADILREQIDGMIRPGPGRRGRGRAGRPGPTRGTSRAVPATRIPRRRPPNR
ncbi:DUF664 domain-containing protein [Salinispora arenicola]|uniref:mycothiol transferase n=1 Tax=Salinispora arenicola TaxID=168697 RepID=UPI001E56AEF2|nr:DUF664 domain-containing protein [Salinispora arenicola]